MRSMLITLVCFLLLILIFACNDSTGPSTGMLDGMAFVSIPSGSFQMGASEDEPGSNGDERPVHTVTFEHSFQIMTTEVTQGMWEELMSSNPASDHGVGSEYPVYNVSWYDCQEFIAVMNELDPDFSYRLPTEAEWEYSCRAGTHTRYYWGDDPQQMLIQYNAWFKFSSGGETNPVAQKDPNSWGLFDMSGNVNEWCQDWSHFNYQGAPSDGSAWENPATADRVFRGGSWNAMPVVCRSAYRDPGNPDSGSSTIGFRLVRVAI